MEMKNSVEKEVYKKLHEAFGTLLLEYGKYSSQQSSVHVYHAFTVVSDMLLDISGKSMKATQVPLWDQEQLGL